MDVLTAPDRRAEAEAYRFKAARASDIERLFTERERDGVFIGAYVINPMNGEAVPIFIADSVLLTYGTGAIQGVPAHDQRDFAFARAYGLPIRVVVAPPGWLGEDLDAAYLDEGKMVNSGPFDGLSSQEGRKRIADSAEARGIGNRKVRYRLHDWLISRQRYWGTPIPITYCRMCGAVPAPYEELPVLLPMDAEFLPTGESPLRFHQGFRKARCRRCGEEDAERETDTMDTFIDSSWYQNRYVSPQYSDGPFDPQRGRYWLPVDVYTGGIEHATMHLLYARFWTKVMRDLGLVDFDEPVRQFFANGLILAPGGERLSTSRGTLVVADDLVRKFGADAVRGYLMFFGPWDQGGVWNDRGTEGVSRFLKRVWSLVLEPPRRTQLGRPDADALRRRTHQTIEKVTADLEQFRFNTAIAALMEYANFLQQAKTPPVVTTEAWDEAMRTLLLLLAPFVPHIAEELWERTDRSHSIHQQAWPTYVPDLARAETITLVIQVNGRVRDRVQVAADISDAETRRLALERTKIRQFLNGREVADVIVVPGRLVNVVTR